MLSLIDKELISDFGWPKSQTLSLTGRPQLPEYLLKTTGDIGKK